MMAGHISNNARWDEVNDLINNPLAFTLLSNPMRDSRGGFLRITNLPLWLHKPCFCV